MITKNNSDYLINTDWFENVLHNEDVVLRYTSALECFQLFLGYHEEEEIYVYAKKEGVYKNIRYKIVDSFEMLDVVKIGNLLCTSLNQTINDMLSDFDNIDEQSLIESLANYYFRHNMGFDGLVINPQNVEKFNIIKVWAIEYFNGG